MEMTKEEIVRKYKMAKKKNAYVQVLADLNGCKKKDIQDILKEAGISLPGNPNFGKVEKKMTIPEEVVKQLKDDLKEIDAQIAELTKRSGVIWAFIKENSEENNG